MSRRLAEAEAQLISGRGYDIAKSNPHVPYSAYSNLNVNDEIGNAMVRARQLVQDVMRNDSIAKHGLRIFVDTILGRGIIPRCDSRNEDDDVKDRIDDAVQRVFDLHYGTPACHVGGTMSYFDMLQLGLRSVGQTGEFFIIKRYRDRNYVERNRLLIPVQYETVGSEWVATGVKTVPTRGGGKNRVINGIEIDKDDNRQAVHFYETDPYGNPDLGKTIRIPIEFVIHFFLVEREGQQRGISAFVGCVQTLYDLGDIADATLKSAKLSAALMLILGVKSGTTDQENLVGSADGWNELNAEAATGGVSQFGGSGVGGMQSGTIIESPSGVPMERMQSGAIARVPEGTTVEKIEPDQAGGFEAFNKAGLRRVAAGPGILYEALSQDWSDSTYASFRGANLPIRRNAQNWRDSLVERVVAPHFWRDLIVGGYIMGYWNLPHAPSSDYWTIDEIGTDEVVFVMPKEDSVDPEKDAKATTERMLNGQLDPADMIIAEGSTIRERFRSMKRTRELAAKYGLEDMVDGWTIRGYKPAGAADSGQGSATDGEGNGTQAEAGNGDGTPPDDSSVSPKRQRAARYAARRRA